MSSFSITFKLPAALAAIKAVEPVFSRALLLIYTVDVCEFLVNEVSGNVGPVLEDGVNQSVVAELISVFADFLFTVFEDELDGLQAGDSDCKV